MVEIIKNKERDIKKIYNKNYVRFFIVSTIILGIFFIFISSIFLILITQGKFQSIITQSISPIFNATVISLEENSFNPNTINEYNNNFKQNITNIINLKVNCKLENE